MSSDQTVSDYLARLRSAAVVLPRPRQSELVAEVGEHIEAALEESGARDEVSVRNVLERLGSPDEIVAAERYPDDPTDPRAQVPPSAAGARRSAGRSMETKVVFGLVLSALVVVLAIVALSQGPSAALFALGFALLTPYVAIPLVIGLAVLFWSQDRERESAAPIAGALESAAAGARTRGRRSSLGLVGLLAVVALLTIALVAGHSDQIPTLAVFTLPVVVALLVTDILRGRGRKDG